MFYKFFFSGLFQEKVILLFFWLVIWLYENDFTLTFYVSLFSALLLENMILLIASDLVL